MNLLTIDVEDWFHTSALESYISREQWDAQESRIERNLIQLLDVLHQREIKATFFILGWVAARYPQLVKDIAAAGHEIASHGWRHQLIYHLDPTTFQDYTRRAKQLLEDITGQEVLGYRATSFSVVKKTLWALDIIKEAGFRYDSSIFPIRHHDLYGMADVPRFPFRHDNGLLEIPPSTVTVGGKNIPFGGGGYFRLYPYPLTKAMIKAVNRQGYPAVIYLHPWELDPECPKLKGLDRRTGFRQYVNLHKTAGRLERLLADFQFGTMAAYIADSFSTG